jgi:O-acetyl-ADP-ribose deacetylase (regulator of RNase III)
MWKLGETQRVQVTDDIAVINMVCQDGLIGPDNPRPIRYDSVEAAIDKVRVMAQSEEASVHMPRIGCGLAGGRWELIEAIIVRKLTNNDIPVTVYDYRP